MVRAQRLLRSLPLVDPWVAFRHRYHDLMITGNLGLDGPRFQAQGTWTTLVTELLLREEFDQKGITMEILIHIFPLNQVPPPPAPPAPAQGPHSPLVSGTPPLPDSSGEAHVVIDIPDTPDLVVISFRDEGLPERGG